jgi:large subunit ribosomal protein L23
MANVNKSKNLSPSRGKGIKAVFESLKKKPKSEAVKIASKQISDEKKKFSAALKMNAFSNVLTKPHVTEKSTYAASMNKYVFEIPTNANKNQVSAAVKMLYNVKPTHVRIIKRKGKTARYRSSQGKRKDIKLAIITVSKDRKLDIYETA